MNYLIGVDLGTQGTKAALMDENCSLIGEAFEESRLIYPEEGAVEQEPEEMLGSILRTVKQVVQAAKIQPVDVAGICVDGQMAGTMGVARNGTAATPYDSWLDVRCGKYREPFLRYGEDKVIKITGAPVTYAHGPKILWWMNEYPEAYRQTHKFLPPAAYCVMRMCGLCGEDAFIDHTYLHFTGFADTEGSRWSDELLEATGVSRDKMPRIVKPYDQVGGLTSEMASRCSLLSGTPVVAGCGDTAASSLGAGIIKKGVLFDVAGTASVLACATDIYAPDVENKTIMYPKSVVDGLYTPMAYINGGGMCIKWFRDDIMGKTKSYRELDEMAEQVPAGSENLFFLPHFSGRVCPNDTLVRGSYINLGWKHTARHMYRAILEGIAYEYRIYADIIKSLVSDLEFEYVVSVGGGSASPVFNGIKADVLGVPITTINMADTATSACCAIAGYGVGLYDSVTAQIEKTVKTDVIVRPTERLYEFYGEHAGIYAGIFSALHGVYQNIGELKEEHKC